MNALIRGPGPLCFRLPAWLTFLFTLGIFLYDLGIFSFTLCIFLFRLCIFLFRICIFLFSLCIFLYNFSTFSFAFCIFLFSLCILSLRAMKHQPLTPALRVSTPAPPPQPAKALSLLRKQNSFQLRFFHPFVF